MIVYEVNLVIDKNIYQSYCEWLTDHIEQLLQLPGFLQAQCFEILENDDANTRHKICIQYHIDNIENLNHYLMQHAPMMRQEGIAKFGNKFFATRRILQSMSI